MIEAPPEDYVDENLSGYYKLKFHQTFSPLTKDIIISQIMIQFYVPLQYLKSS